MKNSLLKVIKYNILTILNTIIIFLLLKLTKKLLKISI